MYTNMEDVVAMFGSVVGGNISENNISKYEKQN